MQFSDRDPDSSPHSNEPGNEDFELGNLRGSRFVFIGAVFEAGLALVAFVLGSFGFHDPNQSLSKLSWNDTVLPALVYGSMSSAAMLLWVLIMSRGNWWPFRSLNEILKRILIPAFAGIPVFEAALISLLAGFGEELLFRWSIQGGITQLVTMLFGMSAWPWAGPGVGLVLASALFGACHWLSHGYALVTFAIGLFLGGLMIWTGTWLTSAIAHGLYDFIIILWLSRHAVRTPNPT